MDGPTVVISKLGKRVMASFNCAICGCEYKTKLDKYSAWGTIVCNRYVSKNCPCCGYTNHCYEEDMVKEDVEDDA